MTDQMTNQIKSAQAVSYQGRDVGRATSDVEMSEVAHAWEYGVEALDDCRTANVPTVSVKTCGCYNFVPPRACSESSRIISSCPLAMANWTAVWRALSRA